MKKQKKLENVAINDILPLKAAGRYAIADAKWFGVPGRLHSLCRAILFGSHQCNLPPPVWQSLRFPFAVCNAWQQSRKENLRRVVENSGSIFTRLWTEVHEIFRRCRRPFVLSNTITWLSLMSMSRYVQKIFTIKSGSRRKTEQMCTGFWPQMFWEGQPRHFYGKLLASFTLHRLAKFGWVPFSGLRLRSLAM